MRVAGLSAVRAHSLLQALVRAAESKGGHATPLYVDNPYFHEPPAAAMDRESGACVPPARTHAAHNGGGRQFKPTRATSGSARGPGQHCQVGDQGDQSLPGCLRDSHGALACHGSYYMVYVLPALLPACPPVRLSTAQPLSTTARPPVCRGC